MATSDFKLFWDGKHSIQPSYKFKVEFEMVVDLLAGQKEVLPLSYEDSQLNRFNNRAPGKFPVRPDHVNNVVMPYNILKKESQVLGTFNRHFTLLDDAGYELKIELNEDEEGTVSQFITFLTKRIINSDGTYNPPSTTKTNVTVTTFDTEFKPNFTYLFKDCSFTGATDTNYAYADSSTVSTVLTFVAESVIMNPLKQKKTRTDEQIEADKPKIIDNIGSEAIYQPTRGRGNGASGF